jgi:uncharacterized protein
VQVRDALFLAGAGLLGGGINAVAGGGSLIVFPAYVAVGYSTLVANVTNSVAQWPGYVGGVAGFRPDLAGQRRRLGVLAVAAAAGSVAGCAVLLLTPPTAFDAVVPFLVLAASLLLALQPRIRRLVRVPSQAASNDALPANAPPDDAGPGKAGPDDARPDNTNPGDASPDNVVPGSAGPHHTGPHHTGPDRTSPDNMAVLLPVTFLAGGYGGYFGGALGVILVGVLSLTVQDSLRRINAAKAVLSLVVASVTVVAFGLFGPVNWVGVAVVAPATLVGGYLGAHLARRLPDRVLRWCVVCFGVTVAILLYLHGR